MTNKMDESNLGDSWNLSQERMFLENILCQRFNFLLVFMSLIVVGAFTTQSQQNFTLAFTFGTVIASLITLSIGRVQNRLEWVLREIKSCCPSHPAVVIDERAEKSAEAPWPVSLFVTMSQRRTIGYWVPLLFTAMLLAAAVCSWQGLLKAVAVD